MLGQDPLHHALGEQGAELAPQIVPLVVGQALGLMAQVGVGETTLSPQVPGLAVSDRRGPEGMPVCEMSELVPVVWRHGGAGAPGRVVVAGWHPDLLVATHAVTGPALRGVKCRSALTDPQAVPSV